MGTLIGGLVALVVGGLLAVGVSAAVVNSQHPDNRTESSTDAGDSQTGPNDTSDQSVLDYGVH
ncbi:MAG: hypothetical protein ACRDT4_10560 [Micromonosporaceae bacterium]